MGAGVFVETPDFLIQHSIRFLPSRPNTVVVYIIIHVTPSAFLVSIHPRMFCMNACYTNKKNCV